MKKKKMHPSRSRPSLDDRYVASMYLRLCHRCLFLNEGSNYIEKCHKCESSFREAPSFEQDFSPDADFAKGEDAIREALNDFESEKAEVGQKHSSEDEDEIEAEDESRDPIGQPISGLSVLW